MEKNFKDGIFGTGIIALKNRPIKIYKTLEDAKQAALQCGVNFVVKHIITDEDDEKKDIRTILAWNFAVKTRDILLKEYSKCGWGEKLSVLRACHNPNWIELTTGTHYNYIFPIENDVPNEVLEELKKLDSAWFTISETDGKNYVRP
ncbi:MAG: hypothetical protein E7004_05895 [Alphaproteobacteria bacterium]|nr:hypothetical protein [Alphaproteobacteria bacterium]